MMRRQNENRSQPTEAEQHVIKLLDELREDYVFEKGLFTEEKFFLVDFYFPKPRKLCLEIDGDYHNEPEQRKKDNWRDNFIMEKRKMNILRITNEDAMGLTAKSLLVLLDSMTPRLGRERDGGE